MASKSFKDYVQEVSAEDDAQQKAKEAEPKVDLKIVEGTKKATKPAEKKPVAENTSSKEEDYSKLIESIKKETRDIVKEQISEANNKMMVQILETLVKLTEKIENMKTTPPKIDIPAPIVHVHVPEPKKAQTVRTIERDGKGWITHIKESIEEVEDPKPLKEATTKKGRK